MYHNCQIYVLLIFFNLVASSRKFFFQEANSTSVETRTEKSFAMLSGPFSQSLSHISTICSESNTVFTLAFSIPFRSVPF